MLRRVALLALLVALVVVVEPVAAWAQEAPDIIPDPNPEGGGRPTNWGGLAAGLLMLVAWGVGGAVLLTRARRRREAGRGG